jgi:hypothetical protein
MGQGMEKAKNGETVTHSRKDWPRHKRGTREILDTSFAPAASFDRGPLFKLVVGSISLRQ